MSVDSFLPRARATRSATSMVGLRSPALQETDALITGFKASSGYLFDGGGDQQSTRKLSETRNQKQFRVGEIPADPLFCLLAGFFRRFPAATRCELAIRCALNRVGESTDIQRLGPNLDRSPRECRGCGFRYKPIFSVALGYARAWTANLEVEGIRLLRWSGVSNGIGSHRIG